MPVRQYANAPATTLASSCTSLATSIVVASTTGLPITFPYTLIIDRGTATEEAVSVTAAAGTTLTVTRGIDSTTAFAHTQNATVVHGITAQDIREANTHVNASSGVHGATGSVVGTTDSQTLTNKNLTSGTNTFPTSLVTLTGSQTLTNKSLTAPVATGSLAGFGGAWTAWTPTITNTTGTYSSVGTTGRYLQIGKTVFWTLVVTINTVGTATGTLRFTLPVACLAEPMIVGTGRENTVSGDLLQVITASSTTVMNVMTYNNLNNMNANGRVALLAGTYEAA